MKFSENKILISRSYYCSFKSEFVPVGFNFFLLAVIFCIFCSGVLFGQSYKIDSEKSTMSVFGTSSLHDWESTVKKIKGNGSITVENSEITNIKNLVIIIPVKSIKSGKGKMDSNTYNALKEKEYHNIEYSLSSIIKKSSGSLSSKGKLTIGGETKTIDMDVKYKISSTSITFSGEINFKMSNYNIEPPTAMMGTIKTGDEVTISYNVVLTEN